jgi:V8-like Glu-specific endopeptidase
VFNKIKTYALGCFLILACILVDVEKVYAVTFPDISEVSNSNSPFLVSLWTVNSDTLAREDKICSGVMYSSSLVITAAHCIEGNGNIVVIAGQNSDSERGETLSIYKWEIHPRYSSQTFQNDIAVGFLNFSSRIGKNVQLNLNPKFIKNNTRLYGWGINQNNVDTGKPMSIKQNDYSASGKKYFKSFNSKTMVAAGFYNGSEKTFGGACSGDSGGPLISKNGSSLSLIGIVSYGSAKGCNVNIPTVYTRISYYTSFILESLNKMIDQYKKENTTRPILDVFSLAANSNQMLEQQTGKYGLFTSAPLQSGGGVASPDVRSIMFQTYSGTGTVFGINAYLTNPIDPCIEKQKGSWLIQISLNEKQNIDFQFRIPKSYGCYSLDTSEYNLAINDIVPPSQNYCSVPIVSPWKLNPEDLGLNVITMHFNEGCLGSAKAIWIRINHRIEGDGGDIEPGFDMWAGPFSTKRP